MSDDRSYTPGMEWFIGDDPQNTLGYIWSWEKFRNRPFACHESLPLEAVIVSRTEQVIGINNGTCRWLVVGDLKRFWDVLK